MGTKAKLIRIETNPTYDQNKEWTGADISAYIDIDETQGNRTKTTRIFVCFHATIGWIGTLRRMDEDGLMRAHTFIVLRMRDSFNTKTKELNVAPENTSDIFGVLHRFIPFFVDGMLDRERRFMGTMPHADDTETEYNPKTNKNQ